MSEIPARYELRAKGTRVLATVDLTSMLAYPNAQSFTFNILRRDNRYFIEEEPVRGEPVEFPATNDDAIAISLGMIQIGLLLTARRPAQED